MAQIRKHPDYSQQIFEQVAAFKELADVAAAHHERLDGRGYHRRLEGEHLPWAARVLTVADMYEAMSARRPYRDAMSWQQIREILTRDAGKGVDPVCLRAWSAGSTAPPWNRALKTSLPKLTDSWRNCNRAGVPALAGRRQLFSCSARPFACS